MKTETYRVEIVYHENGNKKREIWYWHKNVQKVIEQWFQNELWYKNGQKEQKWFENGEEITEPKSNTINIDGKELSEKTIINALKNYFK